MKIVSNPKKIQRYYKVGLYTSLASLLFLFLAVGLTVTGNISLTNYSFLAMALGLILSQIGVFFANRWGKSPRIDERITQSLKGLDDRYTLYHFAAPVPHLLAGPNALYLLVPQYQPGVITYENNRYRQQGVRLFGRLVGQEGLGRPEMEAESYRNDLEKFLKDALGEEALPRIQPVIVFTNPKASVQTPDAPIPTVHVDKLKDFIRRAGKEPAANPARLREVQALLPAQDVS